MLLGLTGLLRSLVRHFGYHEDVLYESRIIWGTDHIGCDNVSLRFSFRTRARFIRQ